jgi:hypothetical protein
MFERADYSNLFFPPLLTNEFLFSLSGVSTKGLYMLLCFIAIALF